jgi:phage terminase small subunit
MARELTTRQRAFVEAYDGNGTQAARVAGYSGSDNTLSVTASELLRNPRIVEAIREREASRRPHSPVALVIATRQERQAFWTKVMNDGEAELSARLKASELLGKSEGDFLERLEVGTTQTLEQLVTAAIEAKP